MKLKFGIEYGINIFQKDMNWQLGNLNSMKSLNTGSISINSMKWKFGNMGSISSKKHEIGIKHFQIKELKHLNVIVFSIKRI